MKLTSACLTALLAMAAVPAVSQMKLNTHYGDGYYVAYPESWKKFVSGSAA